MAINKTFKGLVLLAGLSMLAACSSTPEIDLRETDAASEQFETHDRDRDSVLTERERRDSGIEVVPFGSTDGLHGEALADGALLDSDMPIDMERDYEPVIYFGFDQFAIDDDSMQTLRYYSAQMLENPRLIVTLEGHTDERGSPSYNLALGERRANAVAEAMMLMGVDRSRMTLVSFGEEQPAVLGHNEEAWAKNRRVELRFN